MQNPADGQLTSPGNSADGANRTGPVTAVPVQVQLSPVSSTISQKSRVAQETCSRSAAPSFGNPGRSTGVARSEMSGPVDTSTVDCDGPLDEVQPARARAARATTATAARAGELGMRATLQQPRYPCGYAEPGRGSAAARRARRWRVGQRTS
jgi:hypothetical protein